MSSYAPLTEYLRDRAGTSWEASFGEIERILGRSLPKSAYQYQAWWANQSGPGHSQTKGWKAAGWRTARLDLERRRVAFERDRNTPPHTIDELVEQARAATNIEDRDEIIAHALRQMLMRDAAERLIALGGTMPDFQLPPRERPGV